MKYAFLAIAFLLFSCDSETTESTEVGIWQLSEVLADPGDGSGIYNPVSSDESLTFLLNGDYISSTSPCNTDQLITGTFDSERTVLIPNECNGGPTEISYELINSQLLIVTPPCIEPCGLKYTRFLRE